MILESVVSRSRSAYTLVHRLERGDEEVAIVYATPPPIDVVESVGVDAVEHKEMALVLACHSAIRHGASLLYLSDEHAFIDGCRRVVAGNIARTFIVAKEFCNHRNDIRIVSARSFWQVVALQGRAKIKHQFRYGVFGGVLIMFGAFGHHHIPVVGGVQVCADFLFCRRCGIRNAAR